MKFLPNSLRNKVGTQAEFIATKSNPPVVVVGCMRSGTSFLADKLSGHPQLLKIGLELTQPWEELSEMEISENCLPKGKVDYQPIYSYEMSRYIAESIEKSRTLNRHIMRYFLMRKKHAGRVNYDWANIAPVLKSTHFLNKLAFVKQVLPHAKFIFLIRDVYAHSASLKAHFLHLKSQGKYMLFPEGEQDCWQTKSDGKELTSTNWFENNFGVIPQMWLRLNSIGLQHIAGFPADDFLMVKYENLVKNQEVELQRVFNFLGLLETHREVEHEIAQTKSKIYNSRTAGNVLDKWKDILTPEEVGIIEQNIQRESKLYLAINQSINY